MIDIFEKVFLVFSEKDGNKILSTFKSFVEFCIVLTYSIFSYKWIFGDYTLIDPTSFTDLHSYFLSGNLFIGIFILIICLIGVKWAPTLIFELVNNLLVYILKLIRKTLIWLIHKISGRKVPPIDVYNFVKSVSTHKYSHFQRDVLKYLYNSQNLLKNQYYNISLVIQFSLLVIFSLPERVHIHPIINILLWIILCYSIINQFVIYILYRFVKKYGYRTFEFVDSPYDDILLVEGYNPDKPIYRSIQNKLTKRVHYSDILKDSIQKYSGQNTLVIGIDGKWGDGKSSFINMALESFVTGSDNTKHVLFFNPWNFTNPKELILHFLNDLKRHFKKVLGEEYSGDLDDKLLLYISYITGVKVETTKNIRDEENDTESLKREIDGVLKRINFKLIVVIDDVDRLDKEETHQVFQFVKLVGDFPNVIYIIPFDKQNVTKECGIDEDYIKKIIQVEIKLPPIIKRELFTILNNDLKKLFKSLDYSSFDFQKWESHLNSSLGYYIKNLRDVNRIINTLRFYLSYDPLRELNLNDFVYLTVIQIFDLKLYTYIGNNRVLFTFRSNITILQDLQNKLEEKRKELETNSETFKIPSSQFRNLLSGLFHKINPTGVSDSDNEIMRREHRIGSNEYFDKYFLYPVEGDSLSKTEMERIISNVNTLEEFKKDLMLLLANKTFDFFISRLPDYQYGYPVRLSPENLIRGLLFVGKDIPDTVDRLGFGVFSLKDVTRSTIINSFNGNIDILTESFINEIYNNQNNDIDLLVEIYFRIFKLLGVEREKSFKKEDFIRNENSKLLVILNKSLLDRLKTSLNQLMFCESVESHLVDWIKLDPSLDVRELVKKHIDQSHANFMDFFDKLNHFQWMSSGSKTHTREVYDLATIKKILDFDYFIGQLNTIESSLDDSSDDKIILSRNKKFRENKSIFDLCVSENIKFNDRNWHLPK